jgi:hypothetical protein
MCTDNIIRPTGLKAVKSQIPSWFPFVRFFLHAENKTTQRTSEGFKVRGSEIKTEADLPILSSYKTWLELQTTCFDLQLLVATEFVPKARLIQNSFWQTSFYINFNCFDV